MWGDKVIEFKSGDLIIFPSNFVYPHRVETVTGGDRYSYVSWAY
jgi:predicted 2-oxoglutarate/Fe(II)-dependent dioxygenase YbiX